MMIFLFVALCLFRFLMKDRNLVKWANWHPMTVKSLNDLLYEQYRLMRANRKYMHTGHSPLNSMD